MVSAPKDKKTDRTKLYTALSVRIGDAAGNAPAATDEYVNVILLTLERGTGARYLDRATFEVDIASAGMRIVDFETEAKMNRQVEVYAIDDEGEFVPLFWGEFDQQNLEIISGEKVVVTASVQKHHFGTPLAGPEEYNKVEDANQIIDSDIVFNPQIRGRIYNNQRIDPNRLGIHYLFINPYSAWTSTATTYTGATVTAWNLATAVEKIINLANGTPTFIDNPDDYDILSNAPALMNFTIKRGTYLPEALDQLLEPHGYSWFVDISLDNSDAIKKQIKIIANGQGTEKPVYFQRPGEVLDIAKSNAPEITLRTSLSELANRITVYGDFIKKEATLELKKGWATAQDALTPDELQKKDESGSQYEDYPEVHRKWVFNEGGDYNDLRTETGSAPADLTFFGTGEEYVHRRRTVEDKLLTLDNAGDYRDPYLEYYDNSLAAWKPVPPEWGWEMLPDEIGIYFNGNKPPAELWEQGVDDIANMKIRLTCVVACDKRIEYTATRQTSSPNGRDVELYIDASDRFFYKEVDSGSVFFGVYDALEKDDTTAIQTYAESLRDINDSANVETSLVLFGIVNSYSRGDLVTKVDGRNISFNRNSSTASTKKYPQVSGVLFDYQNHRTVLETRSFG